MSGAPGTVLLLDDEPSMVKALSRLLSAEGFVVKGYTSPEEFFASPLPAGPSCLVLDLAMPGMDGMEVQRRLNEAGGTLPVVFLTSHGDALMRAKAKAAGAVEFLSKPVDDVELLRTVRAALQIAAESRAN